VSSLSVDDNRVSKLATTLSNCYFFFLLLKDIFGREIVIQDKSKHINIECNRGPLCMKRLQKQSRDQLPSEQYLRTRATTAAVRTKGRSSAFTVVLVSRQDKIRAGGGLLLAGFDPKDKQCPHIPAQL
jgi:hypothetical protein